MFTDEELKQALLIATKYARTWEQTSLGNEDYAATAMEKLIVLKEKPANLEAWIKLVIKNMMIDRHRKISKRPATLREMSPEEIQAIAIGRNDPSLTSLVGNQDVVAKLLEKLDPKYQQLLILDAAGYPSREIAEELGYKNARVVATLIKKLRNELKEQLKGSL